MTKPRVVVIVKFLLLLVAGRCAARSPSTPATSTAATTSSDRIPKLVPPRIDASRPYCPRHLTKILQEYGFVSFTNVFSTETPSPPTPFSSWYGALEECRRQNRMKVTTTYEDGTRRSTLATHITTNGGEDRDLDSMGTIEECPTLQTATVEMRRRITTVLKDVVETLSRHWNIQDKVLLERRDNNDPEEDRREGYTFPQLLNSAQHLEHFHIYETGERSAGTGRDPPANDGKRTIDWHTDQGWALAFVPGRIVVGGGPQQAAAASGGFYVRLPDGAPREVAFEEQDQLVLLLGDGIQYINDQIRERSDGDADADRPFALRPVPHAFQMPVVPPPGGQQESAVLSRYWYGRMMLFPEHAVIPTSATAENQKTFGELQEELRRSNGRSNALGCASGQSAARHLQGDEIDCLDDGTQHYCWHTCYNTTATVNPASCASRNLQVACIEPGTGYLWNGETHDPSLVLECVDPETTPVSNATNEDGATSGTGTDPGAKGGNNQETATTTTTADDGVGVGNNDTDHDMEDGNNADDHSGATEANGDHDDHDGGGDATDHSGMDHDMDGTSTSGSSSSETAASGAGSRNLPTKYCSWIASLGATTVMMLVVPAAML